MKTGLCEKCREREATVHLTIIGSSGEVGNQHLCEACYRSSPEGRAASRADMTEAAATPPTTPTTETALDKKPKVRGKPRKRDIPEGLWAKCKRCTALVLQKELAENLNLCPHCQYHFRIGARERVHSLVEACSFEELDADMLSVDVLNFAGPATYESKLADSQHATGLKDAVVTGIGKMGKHRVGIGALDFGFLGGSMGSVVGEKVTRLIEKCTDEALPLIIISSSGGARMYEGTLSLMQMAKTCGALSRHGRASLPYLSVLTDPTMAGVLASFASLGSLIVAEPEAMIGFAGPRVIKETTKAELPPGFQTAEFLLDRGLIDAIIPRNEMKRRLIGYLDFMTAGKNSAAAIG